MKKYMKGLFTAVTLSIILAGCGAATTTTSKTINTPAAQSPKEDVRAFHITAQEGKWEIKEGVSIPVWTYGKTVPGQEIHVKQGQRVKVTLTNKLPDPVTIHWHGYPVPNQEDGIPGVTQNAIKPGETYTYEFTAKVPGTYWYHSHQDSVHQVDKGLYGALIVDGQNEKPVDKDVTLFLDEWAIPDNNQANTSSKQNAMNMGNSGNMNIDHSNMSMDNMNMSQMNQSQMNQSQMEMGNSQGGKRNTVGMDHMAMYNVFTANGKSGVLIEPIQVKKGEEIRLRLINAGYQTHLMHLHGHAYQIVAVDGQPINQPTLTKDLLPVAPGERYDIEFTADQPGKWVLEDHLANKAAKDLKIPIVYDGANNVGVDNSQPQPIELQHYGTAKPTVFDAKAKFNVDYKMTLDEKMDPSSEMGMVYTINGKAFPNTENIQVKEGDKVKITFINNSKADHPMHLHGHFFQVLSKNGKPYTGSPIMKDTLNVKPGEEYEIAFVANNPGNWMFHCHDLHHASAGMMTMVKYNGYVSPVKIGNSVENNPE